MHYNNALQLPLALTPAAPGQAELLFGIARSDALETIRRLHYTHSVPAGKTYYFRFDSVLISFSIPANQNIAQFLLGRPCNAWELSRMWAPDGHEPNLLTRAISACVRAFVKVEPSADVLVSYADPNAGHTGGVYKAASWLPAGQVEDQRCYLGPDQQIAPRRSFHSGRAFLRKAEIEASGWVEVKRPGKHRFARGLTRASRRALLQKFGLLDKAPNVA